MGLKPLAMKKLVLSFSLIICVFLSPALLAQKNKLNFTDPNENFYDTQKRLNKYFKKHEKEEQREREERQRDGKAQVGAWEEEEMGGFELYKRWEYYMEPRVYPSGDKSIAHKAIEEFKAWQIQNAQNKQGGNNTIQSSTWQAIGPFGDPTGGNAGRINTVRFDPTNANGLWGCAPDGGLWSSANNGGTWATNTDALAPIGCSDVAFDPTNSQIMYLATGDGDAGDTYSIGVLKSTDGGASWAATGSAMVWTTSQSRRIYKLMINPLNKNVVFAASNIGLYRTTNGGTTWAVVQSGAFTDIEYKPGDTTTVYGVTTSLYGGSTTFYKSTNGGSTFSATATGLPSSANCIRFALAVTPANSAYVYLLASNSTVYGFYGFYRSTNSGTAFTSMATTPNLLGWSSTGNDAASGGQGWYDLAIAASPTNANEVVVGGVNIWRTTNGGTNWSLFAHWTGSGAPFCHADVHWLEYKNGTTVYVGCDGGVFYTSNSGASFSAINGSMNISQMYKMGNSASTYSLAIAGHQDNGTNKWSGGWNRTMGGDGMSAFIDWNNNNVMYGEQYNGSFNRTTNGGSSWSGITSGITGTGAWNTPWHQDPNVANTIYGGRQQMFKSTNQGTNWSQIGTITGTTTVTEFAVAPSNSQVIYVIKGGTTAQGGNALWKTTNGGTNWTNITGTLPVASARMTWVAVDNTDPNNAWVTFSGYSSGNKVYVTTDGGSTWTNYSTGLPNIPVNCITYWNNTNDGLYVGCDVGGIYYRDASAASWTLYNTGLPNVTVADLAIFYPSGKLRAATYGRGMWEVDLVNTGAQAPIAAFAADRTNICAGMTVNFTDQSTFAPTSWSWVFQSGTPATSTAQNPSVVYNTPGTYSVQLTATNSNGSDAEVKTLYITVSPVSALPLVEGFQLATFPPTNWQNYDDKGDALIWTRNASVGKASTASTYYDNYNLDASGSRDELRAPKYNFSGFSVIKMFFDVAYATYNPSLPQYYDTLAVMVSSDCGVTWNQVYVKGGPTLASTATSYSTAIFTPTAAQWRTDTVYLNSYAGQGNVMVSFQNRGRFGQALYLDNINIAGSGSGAAPNATFSVAVIKCTGQSIQFTDQSTNTPTSWSWTFTGGSPATSTSQNPTVTYTAAGTYTASLVATNGFGSSSPSTQTISVTATPTVTAVASPTAICSGQSTTLTGGGATNYTWTPGGATTSTLSVSPASTSTYTLTGNTGGCVNTRTVSVTVNTSPTVTVNSATVCSGSSATLTATGATTYSWNTGPTTSTISVSPGTTTVYTVTGTTSGCPNVKTATVTVNATPTVTAVAASPTICSGQSTTLTGGGATNYTWTPGGTTTSTVSVSPGTTTTYTVTGATGTCSGTKTVSVTVSPTPTVNATASFGGICVGQSTTLTGSGATNYTWNPGGATTSTVSVSPSSTTTYTLTGRTGNCSATKTITINVTANPTVTVNSVTVCAGSTATLSASGATTYSWNTGATSSSINVTPASTTVYTVTGNTGGCTNVKTSTVTVSPNPTVTVNSTSICSGATTTLTASGATTYSWNTGATSSSISVSPGSTTVYTVTGTTGGCTNVKTSTVTVSPTPTISVNSSSICSGNPTTLNASGATTYSWSPGTGLSATTGSTVTANPPSTTVYTITGTTGSCNSTSTSTVTVVANLTVTVNSATICAGSSTTLSAGGASTYTWNTGPTTSTISVSPVSTTVYTVNGSSGSCNASNTATVTVVALPSVTANTSAGTICSGQNATLTGGGATTYTWSANAGSATTSTVSVSPSSTSTFTVTGTANGCSNTATVSITVNATPVVSVNSAGICNGGSTTLTASGATTYSWSPGTGLSATTGSSVNANPSSTTIYTITGTTSGCSSTSTSTVSVSPTPTVTASSGTICAGGSANLNASGATTYTWNPGGQTGSSVVVTPGSTTTYTVTGDNGGCTGTATGIVTVNNLPGVVASAVQDTICIGGSTGVSASGALSYSWGPSTGLSATTGSNVVANPTVTTTYTVTGTDGNGCTNTDLITIIVNGCTGLINSVGQMQVEVYPNPNNGTFVIAIPAGNDETYSLEIRNLLSQLIYNDKVLVKSGGIQRTIAMPEDMKGVFTLQISSGNGKKVYRLVIE